MEQLLYSLLTFVLLYKYAGLFLIIFIGAIAIPMPSGLVLMASFFFAAQGYLNPYAVAVVGFVGNVLGDVAYFWIARRYGKELLAKIGLRRFLASPYMHELEAKIDRHPAATVFFSRFTTTVTPLVNVMTGLAKTSFRRFFIADFFGQVGEVASCFVFGTFFGDDWNYLVSVFTKLGVIITALVVLLVMALLVRASRRHRRRQTEHGVPT